ncbi:hypothetical protein [Deinococcus aquaedulcis]|uniref:hypothetical protein n=1 Tax=Deinococcus aquaedulcis TaxID=2840455 RepID=UPI001C829B76|nr:hypothetical protein [Deinococcus aquaedulcis]
MTHARILTFTLSALLLGSVSQGQRLQLPAQPAASQAKLLFSYVAFLSTDDHFNSSGTRLQSVAAIIQQDRANYHTLKLDACDGAERYFSSKANRAALSTMVARATVPASLKNRILNATPVVRVSVYRGTAADYVTLAELPSSTCGR